MVEVLSLHLSAFKWKDAQVYLAKCPEPLPIRWSRPPPPGCMPSTITVKLDPCSRWSVSLRINDTRDLRLNPTKKQVGIDLGTCLLNNYQRWRKSSQPKESSEVPKKTKEYKKLQGVSGRLTNKMSNSQPNTLR